MRRFLGLMAVVMFVSACTRDRDTKPGPHEQATSGKIEIREIDPKKRRQLDEDFRQSARNAEAEATTSSRMAAVDNPTTQSEADAGKLYIRGRVQSVGGAPLRGLKLALFDKQQLGNKAPVTVERAGAFQVQGEAGVIYRLMATAEGFAPAVTEDIVLIDQSINGIILTLNRGRTISGIVTSHAGKPVRKATISVMPASDHPLGEVIYEPSLPTNELMFLGRSKTDDAGQFTIERMPAEMKLDVAAEHDWYAHPAYYRLGAENKDTSGLVMMLPSTGEFEGIVVSEIGDGIAGAEIRIGTLGNLVRWNEQTKSDPLGRFEISSAPIEATGTLTVTAAGYYDYDKKLGLSDTPVTVTLKREEHTTITVRCVDAETRQLVTSATVSAAGENAKRATKLIYDVEPGVFQIIHQKQRELSIYASAEGYIGASSHEKTGTEDEQEITLLLRKDVTVTGRVVDGETLQPVAGAEFSAGGGRTKFGTTGADGRFEFDAGNSLESYWAKAPNGRVSDKLVFQLPLSGVLDVGDVKVWGAQPLTIEVVMAEDNQPVPGARVEVSQSRRWQSSLQKTGLTDYQGRFAAEASARESVQVKLPEWNLEKTVRPPVSAEDWKIIVPVGGGRLQGTLLWNGEPVAATVSGEHTEIQGLRNVSVHTGSDGRYEFENLTPGKWSISAVAMADQLATARIKVDISAGTDVVERDIELASEGSRVRGRVINADGEPVGGARVTIETTGANGGVETEQDGSFVTWPVDPKNCELQALHDEEGRSDVVKVSAPAEGHDTPPVILTLRKGTGRVSCEVLSIVDGLPITGANVVLQKDGKQYASTAQVWSVEGPLVIENLPAGNYRLRAAANGYTDSVREITVREEETVERLEILSPAMRVSISVVDARGYLVTGATVMLTPLDQNSLQPVLQEITDERGAVRFSNVAHGTYQVEVSSKGGNASGTITVQHQREVEVQMVVGQSGKPK